MDDLWRGNSLESGAGSSEGSGCGLFDYQDSRFKIQDQNSTFPVCLPRSNIHDQHLDKSALKSPDSNYSSQLARDFVKLHDILRYLRNL